MKKVVILRSSNVFQDSRCTKWINELLGLDYEVTVLCWDRKCEREAFEEMSVNNGTAKVFFFNKKCSMGGGMKNLFKMISFQAWIRSKILKLEPGTIVHACDFDTAYPIYKLCQRNKLKLIYDIFDFYVDCHKLPRLLIKHFRNAELKIINKADATVICTEQRVEQIKGSKPKKLYVIHNTPNLTCEATDSEQNTGRLKVCFIGSLGYDRLLLELISAIPNHPEYDFVFGGVGTYENQCKEASEINKRVKYLGSMTYDKVIKEESKCDILFATYNPDIPNHRFSAPNKFYEAGALSKPVIVCNNTGVDVLVKKYNTGLCIDYNVEQFFSALDHLDKDRDLLKTLGENGNKAYNEFFSWNVMSNKIKDLYDEIDKIEYNI